MLSNARIILVVVVLLTGTLGPQAQTPAASQCAALAKLTFEGNTSITSATFVTSGTTVVPSDTANTTLTNLPPFCRVQGVSKPSAESNIIFEVWLPQAENWNSKFLSSGEGGFAGTINYTRNGLDGGLDTFLKRGYATAGTDTGHRSSDEWWAVGKPEKAIDYLYRAKHLVTVASKGLIAAYYGKPASRSYFNSCSNGGRQGLLEAQRYPDDFDGFVIGAPWNFQSYANAAFVWNAQALDAPGAAIPAAKLPAITAAALAACDAKDGLVDGDIAHPPACRFDPSILLCKGTETDACLTQPQITALERIYAGPENPRTGAQIFPGFSVGGEAGWSALVQGPARLAIRYFSNLVFENPKWDFRTFDLDRDLVQTVSKVGRHGDATATDYSVVSKKGVKIIQYHGWNDQTLQAAYSPEYYDQVVRANGGLEATQAFYRLFMAPGVAHCSSGPGANSFGGVGQQIPPVRDGMHDVQMALENWVENGMPPTRLIATKFTDDKPETRTIKRTRPLCPYPTIPRYRGNGDPNDAANFSCVPQ